MRSKAHESLFIRITCAAAHQRATVLTAVCHLLYLVMSGPLYRMLQAKAFLRHLLPAAPAVFLLKPGHPAKPGACVSPERAYYRQASQEALKKTPPASLALRPVNGRRLSKIIFLAIVKSCSSLPASPDAGSQSFFTLPNSAGGVIPLKHTIQKSPCMDAVPYRGPLFFEQGRSVPAPRAAAAEAAATAAAEAAATE